MNPKEMLALAANLVVAAVALVAFAQGHLSGELLTLVLVAIGVPSGVVPAVRAFAEKLRKDPTAGSGLVLAIGASLATLAAGAVLVACAALVSRPSRYEAELIACNATATTKRESIACENEVRARYTLPDGAPRPLRDAGGEQ